MSKDCSGSHVTPAGLDQVGRGHLQGHTHSAQRDLVGVLPGVGYWELRQADLVYVKGLRSHYKVVVPGEVLEDWEAMALRRAGVARVIT